MRLRAAITRPKRFDEEGSSPTTITMSSSNAKMSKITTPTYPHLLSSAIASSTETFIPAAFPSLPFRHLHSDPRPEHNSAAVTTPTSPTTLSPLPHHSHDIIPIRDEPSFEIPVSGQTVRASPPRRVDLSGPSVFAEMQTSPIQKPADMLHVSTVSWDRIEPGLQLYIFDSLLEQVRYPKMVSDLLGLTADDLWRLALTKKERLLHPESTENLWNYCCSLGVGPKEYIEPEVLQKYMDYFAYAARFEDASTFQRHMAIGFLNQRSIQGSFVDALLPDKEGIWVRPDHRCGSRQLRVSKMQSTTSEDEHEWALLISNTFIHASHNIDKLAVHFKSAYFPQDLRDRILATPTDELSMFEKWLIHKPSMSSEKNPTPPASFQVLTGKALTGLADSLLCVLWAASNQHKNEDDDGEDGVPQKETRKLELFLYATTRTICQSKAFSKKVALMSASAEERSLILEAANDGAYSSLVDGIETLANWLAKKDGGRTVTPMSAIPGQLEASGSQISLEGLHSSSNLSNYGHQFSNPAPQIGSSAGKNPSAGERGKRFTTERASSGTEIIDFRKVAARTNKKKEPKSYMTVQQTQTTSKEDMTEVLEDSESNTPSQTPLEVPCHAVQQSKDEAFKVGSFHASLRPSPSQPLWSPITEVNDESEVSSPPKSAFAHILVSSPVSVSNMTSFVPQTQWEDDDAILSSQFIPVKDSRRPSATSLTHRAIRRDYHAGHQSKASNPVLNQHIPFGIINDFSSLTTSLQPVQPVISCANAAQQSLVPLLHARATDHPRSDAGTSVSEGIIHRVISEPSQMTSPQALRHRVPAIVSPSPRRIRSDKGKKRRTYRKMATKVSLNVATESKASK